MNQSLNSGMIDDEQARAAQAYADHFGEAGRDDPDRLYIDQRYDGYSAENQASLGKKRKAGHPQEVPTKVPNLGKHQELAQEVIPVAHSFPQLPASPFLVL